MTGFSGYIMNTVQSWGSRLKTWLEENDFEVTLHYEVGGVQVNQVLVAGRTQRSRSPQRVVPEPATDIGPAGALALVGLTAGLVALAASSSTIEAGGEETSVPAATEDEILSHCADIEITKLSGDPENCIVCMEAIKKGDRILILPCLHKFHKDCILPWLSRTGQCSVCRTSITAGTEEPHTDPET